VSEIGASSSAKWPEGISGEHLSPGKVARLRPVVPLLALGSIMVLALSEVLGGAPDTTRATVSGSARLAVTAPATLRNGEIFEISTVATARRPIDGATLAYSASLFRHLTINTMTPEPEKQRYKDGMVMLEFGQMDAGETLHFRMSGQSNPTLRGGNEGTVDLRDGAVSLARLPIAVRILP